MTRRMFLAISFAVASRLKKPKPSSGAYTDIYSNTY